MARSAAVGGEGDAPPTELPHQVGADIAADADADPESAARTICLRLLTVRSRTRAELAEALKSRGVPDEPAERVLVRFAEVGLIDDMAFATAFASTRQAERGLAGREIARQLRSKGVAEADVSAALAGIDRATEWKTARRLAARKLRAMAHLDTAVQTRRLVGMLARKGYSPGLAFEVVREVVKDGDIGTVGDDTARLA
jgi:regulatory protein